MREHMDSLRKVAVIPCYNEARFVADVVAGARKYTDKVIVIDDGSTDGTAEVAAAAGASVVRHPVNMGAGEAQKSGFKAAREEAADVLVTLDGDGQHNADEIPQLLSAIYRGEGDLVIGSRFIENRTNVPRYRKFGIDVITWLVNLGAREKITDSQSCYRAYNRKALGSLEIRQSGFSFSVETLIEARERGLGISEVPVSCLYHANGSTINPFRHGICVALAVIALRLRRFAATRSPRPQPAGHPYPD